MITSFSIADTPTPMTTCRQWLSVDGSSYRGHVIYDWKVSQSFWNESVFNKDTMAAYIWHSSTIPSKNWNDQTRQTKINDNKRGYIYIYIYTHTHTHVLPCRKSTVQGLLFWYSRSGHGPAAVLTGIWTWLLHSHCFSLLAGLPCPWYLRATKVTIETSYI